MFVMVVLPSFLNGHVSGPSGILVKSRVPFRGPVGMATFRVVVTEHGFVKQQNALLPTEKCTAGGGAGGVLRERMS